MNDDLGVMRQCVQRALDNGWKPTTHPITSVEIVYEPPSVVLVVESMSKQDSNVYLPLNAPLLSPEFAKYLFGTNIIFTPVHSEVAWRHHQHELLDFWNEGYVHYIEYLDAFLNS